ncbi:MAG: BACON domain-containing protein, partial [Terriglobia bacterium]
MSYRKTLLVWAVIAMVCAGWTARAQNPRLAVSPDALFFRQVGTAPTPSPREFTVHTRGGGTLGAFTVAVATTSGGNWLSVSSSGGSGNSTLTASVNTTGLTSGMHSGTITITAAGLTGTPFEVKVTLEILTTPVGGGGPPTLLAQPNTLKFKVKDDTPHPPARHVLIQSPSGDNFNWTAVASVLTPAAGTWLKTSPVSPASGAGRAMLEVNVDPTGLPNGDYRGRIIVTSGSNSATVSVELEVDNTPASQGGGPGGNQGGGQGGGQGGQGGQGQGQGRGPKLLVTPQ